MSREMIKIKNNEMRQFYGIDKKPRFANYGKFLQSVAKAGRQGDFHDMLDPELKATRAEGLNESLASEGGFLAPPGFSEKILFSKWSSPLIKKLLSLRVEQNRLSLPMVASENRTDGLFDGLQVYQVSEASEKTSSYPKIRALQPSMKKTVALCYTTDELLTDSNLLERFLFHTMSKGLTWDLEAQLISGPGHNSWLGLLNSGAKIRVSKQGGQSANSIVTENIENMMARLLPESHNLDTTVWICNQSTLPELQSLFKVVSGGGGNAPLYHYKTGNEQHDRLAGFEVIVSEHASQLGSENDLILTDLDYYLFTQRSLNKTISGHVNFLTDENCFRFVLRSDGMPILSKPVTPKNGGATVSSIITLETRA